MKDNRDILEKLAWLANDMEYMEAPAIISTRWNCRACRTGIRQTMKTRARTPEPYLASAYVARNSSRSCSRRR